MTRTAYALASLAMALLPAPAAEAGANVQLHVARLTAITLSDRALNHPLYLELRVEGVVSQSDAAVQGLPAALPQTIRLLFRPWELRDTHVLTTCRDLALTARGDPDVRFTVHVFMHDPNRLPLKIEGGMVQSQFNSFVLIADDLDFAAIGCSVQRR